MPSSPGPAAASGDVLVNFAHRDEPAAEVVAEARRMGRKATAIRADVSRAEEARRLAEAALAEFGSVELLVNNAGIDKAGESICSMTEETWGRIIAVNLTGAFNCCKAVVPHMVRRGFGRIVNIASIAGLRGSGNVAYVASKSGMIGLTMSLARELVHHGITVNAVAPGWVDTELLGVSEEQRRDVRAEVPVGWIGTPAHIADGVLFLVRNDYVTGQVINISGGRMIGL
jgi:3-oxoacyl-[acyl-carrier protein] reductase